MNKTMKSEKQALVPRLRFPEFRDAGEWDFRELDDACEVNPSNSTLPESFVYIDLESVEAGQLIKKKKISREGAPSRAQRILRNGDVIFQIVRPYQKNNLFCDFDDDKKYVASTGYAQLRAFGSKGFLYQIIHTHDFVARVLSKCTGSNYPAINSSDLAKIQLAVPIPEEQQKIADCLSSLDALIAAQAEKIDALKSHKKGLMQQLFPREGETVPRLRFPEFRDAGEWEPAALETYTTKIGSGITPRGGDKNYKAEGHPFVRSQNVGWGELILDDVVYIDEETHSSFLSTEIMADDVLLNISGASIGRSAVANRLISGGNVNQHVCIIRTKSKKLNPLFLNQFLLSQEGQRQIDSFQAGGNRQGLNFGQIRTFSIPFPPRTEEQKKVAGCLSSLDALIAAHSERLDALKTHKKGLMQQLFPSPEAVGV